MNKNNENNSVPPLRREDIPMVKMVPLRTRKANDRIIRKIRASIEMCGLLEPLHVCLLEDDRYGIIDGYFRYLVLMDIGIEVAPCLIFDIPDLYTANRQVNHLTPYEEARMMKKALEVVPEERIAQVFGLKRFQLRLSPALVKQLHPMIVKEYDNGTIPKTSVKELATVLPNRQLSIFAMMQNANKYDSGFVKAQILKTPEPERRKLKRKTPWQENRERKKSLIVQLKELQDEHDYYSKLYRQYTTDLMLAVIYAREIITKKPLLKYLEEHFSTILDEIREIIEKEMNEKKEK